MKRREFITLIGGAAAAWPLAARAQQGERMRRVGILMPFPKGDPEFEVRVRAFRQELAKLGWTDGGNLQFDERWTADHMDRVWAEAASLIASNPDAVLATGGRVIPVLMQLSRSIPIVVPGSGRSAWRRLGDKPGAAGRQRHWLYVVRDLDPQQVACAIEADRVRHHSRCPDLQPGQSQYRFLQADLRGRRRSACRRAYCCSYSWTCRHRSCPRELG